MFSSPLSYPFSVLFRYVFLYVCRLEQDIETEITRCLHIHRLSRVELVPLDVTQHICRVESYTHNDTMISTNNT